MEKYSRVKIPEQKEKIRVGVKVIKQLSTTFYGKSRMIFDELVTNARDAMSTKVEITITPENVTVADNGEGMSREDLVRFFYISHTERKEGQIKNLRGIKRKIIGKFGIGKLSMYQICGAFDITTWKDGVESHALFDFDELENKKFIDEIDLKVDSRNTERRGSGTIIILTRLKKQINPVQLRKDLSFTMPLSPDFKVYVNDGEPLHPLKLQGKSYKIDEDVPGVGPVKGHILFTDKNLPSHEAGIYVRVLGRVVNDDPRILDLSSLRSSLVLSRRTWGDIDADGLSEAIQSNRNSFIKDNSKYIAFISWLETKLNNLNFKQYKFYSEKKQKEENEILNKQVVPLVRDIMTSLNSKRSSKLPAAGGTNDIESFELLGKTYKMRVEPIGEDKPESIFDNERHLLVINSDHLLYKIAEKLDCQNFHALRAAIVAISLKYSKTLNQFKRIYESMSSLDIQK